MPNEAFDAVCPFFYKTIGNKMFCEANFNDPGIDKSVLRIEFESAKKMREFAKERCCTEKYFSCHVAACNLAFYEQRFYQQKLAKACLGKVQVNKHEDYIYCDGDAKKEW